MQLSSPLYWVLLIISGSVFVIALGPGLFGDLTFSEWFVSWQRSLFATVCHQQPLRSFYVGEVPMAVCSRCIGIYGGLFAGSLILPIFPQHKFRSRYIILTLLSVLLLNMIDVIAYALSIWDNTTYSRLIAGMLLGFFAVTTIGTNNITQISLRS